MISRRMTVYYETPDGDELVCKYIYHHTPGFISGPPEDCYPDEDEADEPDYYLNGGHVEPDQLSDELAAIAEAMYESTDDPRFVYKDEELDD